MQRLLVAFPSKSATAVPASELAVCHAKLPSGNVDLQVGHEYLTGRESKALQFKHLCSKGAAGKVPWLHHEACQTWIACMRYQSSPKASSERQVQQMVLKARSSWTPNSAASGQEFLGLEQKNAAKSSCVTLHYQKSTIVCFCCVDSAKSERKLFYMPYAWTRSTC